jgi:hypothetical protein
MDFSAVTPGWVYPVLLPRTPLNALSTTFQVIMGVATLRCAVMRLCKPHTQRHPPIDATSMMQQLVTMLFEGCKPETNFFDALLEQLHHTHVNEMRPNLVTNPIQQLSWIAERVAPNLLPSNPLTNNLQPSTICHRACLAPQDTVWGAIDAQVLRAIPGNQDFLIAKIPRIF